MTFKNNGTDNNCSFGENISVEGFVEGNNNNIVIDNCSYPSSINLRINGNNNVIHIETLIRADVRVEVGTRVPAHRTNLSIGKGTSIEPGAAFLLVTSGSKIHIGSDCLIAADLRIRCGEMPHLLFSKSSGEYVGVSEGVHIGDHVWIGERVYLTKNASVAKGCVIAACSVVTKRFAEPDAIVGGNPARIVKRDVEWVRNPDFIKKGTAMWDSYHAQKNKFE